MSHSFEKTSLLRLPGMDADERLFVQQRKEFPFLETPRWIHPRKHESLRRYAPALSGVLTSAFSTTDRQQIDLLIQMHRESGMTFLKWSARAIPTWKPRPLPPGLPVHRIHGARDRVIPPSAAHGAEMVSGTGQGYLLIMSHGGAANALIRHALTLVRKRR